MTVAPQPSWPPTVGRYLLYAEIASGGMATVHFGRLQGAAGFARSVAIKRLHPQYARDPDFVEMFLDEARLAARIAHPNVVPTLDIVAQGDELLLIMEYVRGSALSRLLRTLTQIGERMPVRIAAAIAAGVLRGLHAAHEATSEIGEPLEIVHRDVSPQNVLVGTDGIPRVLDFGVAKAAGRVQTTREGQLKGKLAYMAPEQITTGSVTRKTDIYAAAVVLWEMLTGRRLFRADNEAKLLALVLDGEVHPPSALVDGLAEGFDRVVMRGIDRDPAKRYATAREMAIDVESIVGIAPSSEVGEWVEALAADELRERTSRLEEIERSVRMASSSPSGGWPTSLTSSGVARRTEDSATVSQGGRASSRAPYLPVPKPPEPSQPTVRHGLGRTGSEAPLAPGSSGERLKPPPNASQQVVSQVSQVSHLSVSHTDPPRASKRSSGLVVAAAVALCAAGATIFALRPSHSKAAAMATSPQAPTASGAIAKAVQAPAPSASWTSTPSAPPAASTPKPPAVSFEDLAPPPKAHPKPPTLSASPSPQPPQQAPGQPSTAAPPAPGEPRGLERPAVKRPSTPTDCNPPYTTDEKGHIHFKPACLN